MGETITTTEIVPVQRVNQLDAVRLDEELFDLLRSQFRSCIRLLHMPWIEGIGLELDAALQFAYFWFTVYSDVPSPGNRYQNIRYSDGSSSNSKGALSPLRTSQKLLLCFFHVGLRYGWRRLEHVSSSRRWAEAPRGSWQQLMWRLMLVLEKAYHVLAAVNFVAFLFNGTYRSLPDRFVRAKLNYIRPNAPRTVTFEFLNRQLVWEGFTDFVLFASPLLRSSRWISVLRAKAASVLGIVGGTSSRDDEDRDETGSSAHRLGPDGEPLLMTSCGICSAQKAMMPHLAIPCSHRFCFACIASKMEEDVSYACPVCSAVVEDIVREDFT